MYAGLLFCGSEPARDGGLTADLSFADVPKPLWEPGLPAMAVGQPTNFSWMYTGLLFCGSEPARDGGLTANQSLMDVPSPTVGAGLLAKAVCHSALMLDDTPLSRASPFPQGNMYCFEKELRRTRPRSRSAQTKKPRPSTGRGFFTPRDYCCSTVALLSVPSCCTVAVWVMPL